MRFLFAIAALVLAASCSSSDRATLALATVTRVGPAELEPGDVLRVEGTGFVEGPVRVTLEGSFITPGARPLARRRVSLDGMAPSGNAVEVPMTTASMALLTDAPAAFEGIVQVRFPDAARQGPVEVKAESGTIRLQLSPTGGAVPAAALEIQAASRFLEENGLVVSDSPAGDDLLVAGVTPGGPADRAGIGVGDRLLDVDSAGLKGLKDLARLTPRPSHVFEIVSPGGEVGSVTVQTDVAARLDPDELAALVLSAMALGLFWAFAAPSRRRPEGEATSGTGRHPLANALSICTISAALLIFPAAATLLRAGMAGTAVLLAAHALGLAFLTANGHGSTLGRIAFLGARIAPLFALLGVAFASGEAMGLYETVAGQHATAWGWHAWSSPFALAVLVATVALLWPANDARDDRNAYASILAWAAAVPASMLVVTFGLGGWLVPGAAPDELARSPSLLVLGSLGFCVKGWIVLLAARWFAAVGIRDRREARARWRPAIRLVMLGVASAAALAWIWLDLPSPCRIGGQVLATAAFVAILTAFVASRLKGLGHRLRPVGAQHP
ncbi:MAG: PDZ domain-containing protein [Deltaproteobacteria bacterium]|nr:PDZ domain-containing protein [Deltaproteobacteria bacterium]